MTAVIPLIRLRDDEVVVLRLIRKLFGIIFHTEGRRSVAIAHHDIFRIVLTDEGVNPIRAAILPHLRGDDMQREKKDIMTLITFRLLFAVLQGPV